MKGHNKMSIYVEDYFNKKMLCKLGYRFSSEDLESADVEAYSIISSVIHKYQDDEMKKSSKGRPRRR